MKITSQNTFKFISLFPHTRRNAIERHKHTQIHTYIQAIAVFSLSLGKFIVCILCMFVCVLVYVQMRDSVAVLRRTIIVRS